VLVREYQGERHTVTIAPDGFLWREKTYRSLSVIAQEITGTKWNGPRFFGLRMPDQPETTKLPKASEARESPPARPNRSSVRASSTAVRRSAGHG
jgi:hypothetical protein